MVLLITLRILNTEFVKILLTLIPLYHDLKAQ